MRKFIAYIPTVYAQTQPAPTPNLGPDPANLVHLQQLIQRIINISVGLAFIALTVVLVYTGILFLTSGGDSKATQNAYNSLTWSLLGILFLALAWLILLLIKAFTGVNVTQFCLGFSCS
ncbi:hypothetical protein HY025_02765 [Candidatus Daviesbacteria bacterium]|nr:hypothetical protein [Candidatus Daviesbacteria bacterium]